MGAWGYPLGHEKPGTDLKHRQIAFDRKVSDALRENVGGEVTSDSWGTSQDTDLNGTGAAAMRKGQILSV